MTREEAIKAFEEIKASAQSNLGTKHAVGCDGYYRDRIELAEAALKALRPVSREQVEKVWRGEWVGVPSMGVYDTACSKCGYCPGIRFWDSDFCPNCGAPMTDEAVEMVIERLEAMKDEAD